MKRGLLGIGLSFVFLLFGGCAHKESIVSKYYPNYTKDAILLAGKYAFLSDTSHEYVIDAYRDRLEVTKIGLVFNELLHEDYILKVEEDACGTMAMLTLKHSFGMEKTEYRSMQLNRMEFLEKMDFFVLEESHKSLFSTFGKDKKYKNIFIEPTKEMDSCVIKYEFENGFMKNDINNTYGVYDENR